MQIISACSSPYFQKKQPQPVRFSGIHLKKQSNSIRVPYDEFDRNVWYTGKEKDAIITAQRYLQRSPDDPLYQFHSEKISQLGQRTRRVIQAIDKRGEGRSANGRQEPSMGSIPEEEENA